MGVVGAKVNAEVSKQLEVREQLYAGINRDIQTIQTQNNTSWARIASSVDIEGSSQQAKNFVLFGGPAGSSASIAAGSANYFNETYPFSSIQGNRPIPGIQGIDFKYKNNGALATCDINITCFTFEQFNIIEKLYLRPGYSILVEWGHTKYVTNGNQKKALQKGDVDGALTAFLSGKPNQGVVINKIKKQKKQTDYNYDGFFGKIVNFSWSFNPDLSYSITIKTITHGDIIENLKINTATPESLQLAKQEREAREAKVDKDAAEQGEDSSFLETLGKGLSWVGQQIGSFFEGLLEGGTNLLGDLIDSIDDQTWINKLLANRTKSQIHKILFTLATNFTEAGSAAAAKGAFVNPLKLAAATNAELFNLVLQIGDLKVEKLRSTTGVPARSNAARKGSTVLVDQTECIRVAFDVSSADDQDLGNFQYYLTFGALLKIIEQTIFQDEAGLPLVSIDCQYGNSGMVTFPGQISADPLTCLIPLVAYPKVQGKDITYTGFNYKVLNDPAIKNSFLIDDNDGAVADLMRVMLNFNFIIKVFDENTNEDGDLLLIDFVKKILDGITESLGGINKFQTRVIHEGLKDNDLESRPYLSIYDEGAHIQTAADTPTFLKPYGVTNKKGSTFLDVTFNSELSNEFASQISIGAQANGNQPGEDATAFSEFNKGLIDRMIAKKSKPGTVDNPSDGPNPYEAFGTTLLELKEATNTFYADGEIDKDVIKTAISANSTYAKFCIGELTQTQKIPAPFFIPFNLQIKMKGISGIKIFDKIFLEDDILPKAYRGNVAFILKGVNHSINDNQWITTLETLTVPRGKVQSVGGKAGEEKGLNEAKRNAKRDKVIQAKAMMKQEEEKKEAEARRLAGGGGGGGGALEPGTGKTLINGRPYNGKFYSTTVEKTQLTVHYTASSRRGSVAAVTDFFSGLTSGVATHYIHGRDGTFDLLFPHTAWAYHLGVDIPKDINKAVNPTMTTSQYSRRDMGNIGIEVQNAGMLKPSGGKYRDTIGSGIVYEEKDVSRSVDQNGKEKAWRGNLYWEKFTDVQIKTLENLIIDIIQKNPGISPTGKPWKFNYVDQFPPAGHTSGNALKGVPGIYTHNSFTLDKSDVPPVPEIIDMFKRIEKRLANGNGSSSKPKARNNCPNAISGVNWLRKQIETTSSNFGYNIYSGKWVNNDKKNEWSYWTSKTVKAFNKMKDYYQALNTAGEKATNYKRALDVEKEIKGTWKGNAKAWASWTFAGDGNSKAYYDSDFDDEDYDDALEAIFDRQLKGFNKESDL